VTAPDDANDLRGLHFRLALRKPSTRVLLGVAAIAGGAAAAAFLSPPIGLIAVPVVLLLGVAVVFLIADKRAADAFFQAYALGHDLLLEGRSRLPEATPLLRRGSARYAQRALTGTLADGVDGTLALFTYEEKTHNGKTTQTTYYHYTLALTEVPECVARVPELYCQRKSGLRALEKFEDVFRGSKERVHLHRLDDRLGAGEVCLRAGRRHPLLLHQRSQGDRRRARCSDRRQRRCGEAAA
jgi:hypothetical protein